MGARYDPVRKLTYGPFYFTEIDMASNGGEGAITKKNQVLTDGDLEPFSAVRHGNGRDWWIVVPVYSSSEYRFFLLDPAGITGPFVQMQGPSLNCRRVGTSAFALNGKKFVRTQNCRVVVMDFDRCQGSFSNTLILNMPDQVLGGGSAAFSSDNKRLIVSTQLQILEADLTAPTPKLDSAFLWDYQWGVSLQHFQHTPFGQILINHMHRTNYFSLIDNPDLQGSAMGFEPRGVLLPVFSARSLPHFPNYRLYDLSDSPCDTLGIDAPVSAMGGPKRPPEPALRLYPNPASEEVSLAFNSGTPAGLRVTLLDVAGCVALSEPMARGAERHTYALDKLPAGLYFVLVEAEGRLLAPLKLSVVR